MKGPMRLVVPLALLCLIVGTTQASMDYATGSDTVQYALARPDGVRVSITMVVIGRIDANGISVHEWWDKTNPIPVLLKPTGLKVGQTIDIEGRMTTSPGGKRSVVGDRIALYLDKFGYVAPGVPPLKGILEPSVWPSRRWMQVTSLTSMSAQGITALDEPGSPPPGEPPPVLQFTLVAGRIIWAKSFADATALSQPLTGKVVTAATGQIPNCIYIEEPDRSCGIRVQWTGASFILGDRVQASGTMYTNADGERYIGSASVSLESHGEQMKPTGLVNREIGGGAFMDGQTTLQQGVLLGMGLNNIGLLVRTWGKVTYKDASCMYIDDGTAPADGSGHVGVRVEPGGVVVLPPAGTTAEFTGISSCTMINSNVVRAVRLRTQDDAPVVMHVKPTGNNANDGSTWALAKLTVQAAINAATPGMEIWVAAGTYNERITLAEGRRLYGGFAGNEIRRESRSVLGNPTILDGGASGSVVTSPAGLTSSTVIDGFTIRNGWAASGGGIYCSSSSPTIANNAITGNEAEVGGGVYCESSSLATITSNTIIGNSASWDGAGIYCYYSSAIIVNNTISGNNCDFDGGGVYCHSCSPTITNNIITDNRAGDNGGAIRLGTSSSPTITNNTIASNTATAGGGLFMAAYCLPAISNNIVAFNTSGIHGATVGPSLSHNCVYSNSAYDYYGLSAGTGDISADPSFVDLAQGHLHIQPMSPCIDAGSNQAPGIPLTDMDGQPRIQNDIVDIGADESDGCGWYCLTISMNRQPGIPGGTVTVTANISPVVEGVSVCFTVSDGAITEINGHPLAPGTTSEHGETDPYGNVTAEVTLDNLGIVTVRAEADRPCGPGQTTTRAEARFGIYKAGFVYDLCQGDASVPEGYLTLVDESNAEVIYQRITGTPFAIGGSFNTVFVDIPSRPLLQAEIDLLAAFVQSGRQKRVVLLGEYGQYSVYYGGLDGSLNARLNTIAAGIGMNARFSDGSTYDSGPNRGRLCIVDTSHYLAAGVVNLWDAATSTFASGWESSARPLAYINAAPTLPWILEEDTPAAGSRILIHDDSIFVGDYDNRYDTIPDKNFQFIYNLCTVFPE